MLSPLASSWLILFRIFLFITVSVGCTSRSWSQIKLVLASVVNQHFSMGVSSASTEFQLLLKRKEKKQSSSLRMRSKLCACGPVKDCSTDTVGKEKQWESLIEPQRGPAAGPNGSIACRSCGCLPVPSCTPRADGVGTLEGRWPAQVYKWGCCKGEATWSKPHPGVPSLRSHDSGTPSGTSTSISWGCSPCACSSQHSCHLPSGPFSAWEPKGKRCSSARKAPCK